MIKTVFARTFSVITPLIAIFFTTTAYAAPQLLKDIHAGTNSSAATTPVALGSTLLFAAQDGFSNKELWKSDGTEAGTVQVKNISNSFSSNPAGLTVIGSTCYFSAGGDTGGSELWKSDGTEAGTVLVKDIRPGSGSSSPGDFASVGSTLYFTANDGTNGIELWKSDGTEAGTVLVKNIETGSGHSQPRNLTVVGSTLFFDADTTGSGRELWKSDGTEVGTVRVKDIETGTVGSSPFGLTAVGSTLFFRATVAATGSELWKSDGTEAGTVMVKDIRSGSASAQIGNLKAMDGTLYFRAGAFLDEEELWKSDGTAAGTVVVKDLNPSGSASTGNLTVLGSTLYFTATDGSNGVELWKTDGSAAGTLLVKDIRSGSANADPGNLTVAGDKLYFSANDGSNGIELWKSDGTAAGTVMVGDPTATTALSDFRVAGSYLYFFSTVSSHGKEPYVLLLVEPTVLTGSFLSTSPVLGGLTGTVSPNGIPTQAWFEWGLTSAYGQSTTPQSVGAGTSAVFYMDGIGPLTADTEYHFRIVAENAGGTVYGADQTFRSALNDNANLASLTLSAGTLTPTFDPSGISYTVNVANSVSSIEVISTLADLNASLTVNGTFSSSGVATFHGLVVGNNSINIQVRAQNTTTLRTYVLTVNRAASTNANLSSLNLSSGAFIPSMPVTLTPAFDPSITTYTATVPFDTQQIGISAIAQDLSARIMGPMGGFASTGHTGQGQVGFFSNSLSIMLNVTAQDFLFFQHYTVNVTRQTPFETWIANFYLPPALALPTADADLDGLLNIVEYAFGLIPTSGTSVLLPQAQRVGNNFVVSFQTPNVFPPITGITYGAEWSTDLNPNTWTNVPDTGTEGTHTFSVPIDTHTRIFMRLTVD